MVDRVVVTSALKFEERLGHLPALIFFTNEISRRYTYVNKKDLTLLNGSVETYDGLNR